MNYIGKFISNFKEFYNEINSATLTGAIDVIIVKQPDGTFACSPFHVRFGKMGVLRSKEKIVDIEINGEPVNIHMKLGDTGEAFFVEEFEVDDDQPAVPSYLATSPLPSQLYDTGIDYIGNQLEKMRKEAEDPIINQSAPCTPGSPSKISLQGMITGDSKIPGPFGDDTSREIARTINSKSSRELCGLIENRVSCDSSQDESIFISDRPESCYLSLEGQDFSFRKSVALQTSEPVADSNEEKTKEFFQSQQPIPSTIVPPSSLSSKKRRRKKSTMKKLSNVKSPSKDDFNIISQLAATPTSGVQTTPTNLSLSSNEVEEVFVMDDDDANICSSTMYSPEEETVSGMTRSASLPAASLSSFSNVNTNVPSTPTTTTTTTKQKFLPLSDIHPFSDGEVDQLNLNPSHKSKRPSSPLSDTEYENSRLDVTCQTSGGGEHIEWGWGEFPRSNTPNNLSHSYSKNSLQTANQIKTESGSGDSRVVTNHQTGLSPNESSKLFGVLKFMKKDDLSKSHASKEEEGVFLDDLNTMDPEKAGLYLSSGKSGYKIKPSSLDDTESGNGSSLSQSPPCSGPTSQDEEESELEGVLSSKIKVELTLANYERFLKAIAISVCGGLDDDTISIERFEQSFVAFDDFCSNPIDILQNPALVVRIDGKYYNWPAAAPLIMSLLLYQRPLPVHCINTLLEKTMPKKQSKPQQQSESRSFWWSSWTRSSVSSSKLGSVNSTSPSIITQSANLPQSEINNITEKSDNHSSSAIVSTAPSSPMTVPLSDQLDLQMQQQQQQQQQETITQQDSILSQLEKDSISVEIDKDNHQDHEHFHVHDSENLLASSELDDCQDIVIKASDTRRGHRRKNSTVQYKKVLRISSRQIASLNLQEGRNEVVFSVTTAYQGTTRCKCSIYLWNHDDKIIVSDIDGTITKSDILGHILPVIGKDWAQSGVANLFNKIQDNGYKLLYLSARAIGQARITRDYLKSVRQGDICLPDGPLLLSPTSLISALHREVIEKKPEEFKIKCLRDIQCLFPTNPFYAGFGNKINDTWAYRAINIPSSRIFTINHRGELRLGLIQSWHSSYNRLSDLVDQMFPPLLDSKESRSSDFLSEYSSFNYWREPVLDISQFEPTDFDKGLDNEELPQQQEQQEQQQAQPQPQPQQLLQLQQSPSPTNQQLHSSLVTP